MTDTTHIGPGDWITVGRDRPAEALVCSIRPKRIEVVFLDNSYKALHKEVRWAGSSWEFVDPQKPGSHADKDPRLEKYVKKLRAGK